MGALCTNSNKQKKHKTKPNEAEININNSIEKVDKKTKFNETVNNYFNTGAIKESNNKLQKFKLKDYKFYFETFEINDFFIISNFENLKYVSTIEKLYKKWEEILQLTREQRKFSYRNLNQNHNFMLINNNDKRNSKFQYLNNHHDNNKHCNEQENIEHKNNFQHDLCQNKNSNYYNDINKNFKNYPNIDNIQELINFNINNVTYNNTTVLPRLNQMKNFINETSHIFYSNLIKKFQTAFCFNKYRYIKYLSKGPPNNIRWPIWISLAFCQSGQDFLTEDKYLELIKKIDTKFETFEQEQIRKDLNRSNENQNFFLIEKNKDALYNILKALAIDDPELGYCQGMNILAANFLMISDGNEFESFNLLRFLFKHLELREFFLNGFPKLIMYIFILKEFIKDNLPKLFIKISELDIPEETWIFKWLQTLYNLTLPISISIRVIDCVLCFGLEFLLNYSLAFIKYFEKKLMVCEDINDFLKTFKVEEIINPNILYMNLQYTDNNNNLEDIDKIKNKEKTNTQIENYHNSEINKNFIKKYSNNNEQISQNNNKDLYLIKTKSKENNLIDDRHEGKLSSPHRKGNKIDFEKDKNLNHQESSYFNLTDYQIKELQYNKSNITYIPKNDIENLFTNDKKEKDQNLNSNNSYIIKQEDQKSQLNALTNNTSSTKFMINTKDDLLWFREKLITNAKKIDLKDAIKKMIETYTQENMEIKNKFQDNDSSTGDGLNEDKSIVYENDNYIQSKLKENPQQIILDKNPFEICFKNPVNENLENHKPNVEFKIKESKSLKKTHRDSKNEHIINEVILEEKDDENNDSYNIRTSNNLEYKKDTIEKYQINTKVSAFFNKTKFCDDCYFNEITNKDIKLENSEKEKSHDFSKKNLLEKKDKLSLFCNKCSEYVEKTNLHDPNNNKIINKQILVSSKVNESLEKKDLRVNLYFEEANQNDDFMMYNNNNNPENVDMQGDSGEKKENPFKKSSLAELRLSNLNESSERFSLIKRNPYSCKNLFLTNFNSLKNENYKNFAYDKDDRYFNEKPDCVPKIKTPLGTCKNIEKSNPYRSYFSFNYNSPKPELHRFSIENYPNNSSTSRVLTVEQISLIHNIKDKLEIIKGYDYLDIEENENEEHNDLYYNVDENFDSNIEWEHRSKINRNINEGGNNIRKMSEILSPDYNNSSNNVMNIHSANEFNEIYEKTKSNNGISKNYEVKVNGVFNEMDENEKEINLDLSHFHNHELNSLYENSNCDFHDSINKSINLNENNNEHTQENLKFNKKTKKTQFLNEQNINNFNLDIYDDSKNNKITKNSKEQLSKPYRDDDKIINLKNNFENNCSIEYINDNKHLSHSFVDNFNNQAVSLPFDEFNKSMDLKMKNEIFNLDKKKSIIVNLGLDSYEKQNHVKVHEKKNFLHIKIDDINRSRINDNNEDNQIGKKYLDKSNLEKDKNFININLKESTDKLNNLNNKDKEEKENDKILISLIEEKYNAIYDEYSTIDRRNQNTRNIKEFKRIGIKDKNNLKK